jgi:hypothetical protein
MTVADPYEALKARMAEIRERFDQESADGTVKVLRDEGLYRHLECEHPKSSAHWFEVVTWPGALALRGHTGSYVFTRDDDMLDFFRTTTAGGRLDPMYLGEKIAPSGLKSVTVYSEERLRAYIAEAVAAKEPEPGDLAEMVDADLTSQYAPADLTTEGRALAAVGAFEFDDFRFDTTGWEITELDYSFLYSCHALAWTVEQYDLLRAPVPA